jgi:transposase
LSETRKYRKFTSQQKTEIVLASLRGPKTMTELCREHDIADSLLARGASSSSRRARATAGQERHTEADELRR